MPRQAHDYLQHEKNRHGNWRWYFRRPGEKRVRLPDEYGTKVFWSAYYAALAGEKPPQAATAPETNSLAWLVGEYQKSAQWRSLAEATQGARGNILKRVLKTGSNLDIRLLTPSDVSAGMDSRAHVPNSANTYLKTLRKLFEWGVEKGFMDSNPAESVKLIAVKSDGHHVWSPAEVRKFQERWPLGTAPRVAMDLLLYTGLRRSDAVMIGPQHVDDDGMISYRTQKTGEEVFIPILPVLQKTLDAGPIGEDAFICQANGRPRKSNSFGNWFQDRCKDASVPGRAHGLRKAGATLAAENGATPHQLSALFGWSNTRMAEIYTRKVDRKRLAKEAIRMLDRPHPKKSAGIDTGE